MQGRGGPVVVIAELPVTVVVIVNVVDLDGCFQSGDDVTPDSLRAKNLAKGRYDEIKILGNGRLSKKLRVSAHRFSKTAAEKIEKAGGKVVVLPGKTTVAEKVKQKKAASTPPADSTE